MTVQFATAHAPATQVHHWEVSVAPMALVFGVFFLLPLSFSAYFVYESLLLTAVLAGIGVPLVLFGVSKWVAEGLGLPAPERRVSLFGGAADFHRFGNLHFSFVVRHVLDLAVRCGCLAAGGHAGNAGAVYRSS